MSTSSTGPGQLRTMSLQNHDLQVIEMDFKTDPRWERFVNTHPDGLIYHHPGWLQALEYEYGQKCIGLACVDPMGQLRGVLPLIRTNGLPFQHDDYRTGRRLSSLPRTPMAGPLSDSEDANVRLVCEAIRRTQNEAGLRLELKTKAPLDLSHIPILSKLEWRTSYVLDLPHEPERLRFGSGERHRKLKWSINKAEKRGLVIREAEDESDLRTWYKLYLYGMRHNVVPARSYRFFAYLWQLLQAKRLMRLVLVEESKAERRRLVAGSIFLLFNQTVSYAFSGSRQEDMWLCPNDVLHWHHIHQACTEGYRWYDFGEVPDKHKGLAAFKSKWGAAPVRLQRYYYPEILNESAGHRTEIPLRVVGAIWKRLPLAVTAAVSDRMYRYF